MLISDVFVENPFANPCVIGLSQWRDCDIYVIKTQYNVTKCN